MHTERDTIISTLRRKRQQCKYSQLIEDLLSFDLSPPSPQLQKKVIEKQEKIIFCQFVTCDNVLHLRMKSKIDNERKCMIRN